MNQFDSMDFWSGFDDEADAQALRKAVAALERSLRTIGFFGRRSYTLGMIVLPRHREVSDACPKEVAGGHHLMRVGIGHSFSKFVLRRAGACCCGGGQPEGISGREGRKAGGMTGGEKDVR